MPVSDQTKDPELMGSRFAEVVPWTRRPRGQRLYLTDYISCLSLEDLEQR